MFFWVWASWQHHHFILEHALIDANNAGSWASIFGHLVIKSLFPQFESLAQHFPWTRFNIIFFCMSPHWCVFRWWHTTHRRVHFAIFAMRSSLSKMWLVSFAFSSRSLWSHSSKKEMTPMAVGALCLLISLQQAHPSSWMASFQSIRCTRCCLARSSAHPISLFSSLSCDQNTIWTLSTTQTRSPWFPCPSKEHVLQSPLS